jgi:hypothetical protein
MRGVYWNSNGFKDLKKHKFVSDLMKEHNLNFIAISETGRSDFTPRFLKNLCSGRDYLWHCKPPKGRSSGMLLGVDLQFFDIGAIDEGDHYIKFHLYNKSNQFKWALVVVYSLAQAEHKESFLAELVNILRAMKSCLSSWGVIIIFSDIRPRKILITSMLDGRSCLMLSLMV